jgi:hypothetical protein
VAQRPGFECVEVLLGSLARAGEGNAGPNRLVGGSGPDTQIVRTVSDVDRLGRANQFHARQPDRVAGHLEEAAGADRSHGDAVLDPLDEHRRRLLEGHRSRQQASFGRERSGAVAQHGQTILRKIVGRP